MVDLGADAPVDDNEIEPGANLYGVDLPGADLSGADLSDSTLSEADLSGADLSGVNLYNADLYKADLPRADLSGATLTGATLSKIDLSDASLSSANLSNTDLSNADLSGADFSDADLSNADLSNADLSGADFSDAYVSDANLSGADLSDTSLSDIPSLLPDSVMRFIGVGGVDGARRSVSESIDQSEITQPETTTQPEAAIDEQSGTVPSRVWPTIIALAIPGWLVLVLGASVIPTNLYGLGGLAIWVALPAALFIDARALRETGEWPQYWWTYVLASVLGGFAIIPAAVYLWRRRTHRSQTSPKQGEPSER